MAGGSKISGIALGSIFAGSVFLYAGITGRDIPSAFQSIVQGKSPKNAPVKYPIQQVEQESTLPQSAPIPGGDTSLGAGSGANIAADALQYVGHCYTFGGAPGLNGKSCWDCSSFANWVIGHDMGLAIPFYQAGPGGYNGSSHGPPTMAWFVWNGCVTIGTDPNKAQAGDLAIWDIHHMGICLGPNQMVSAQNPSAGTQVSAISGFSSGAFAIRRLKAVIQGPTSTIASAGPH